MSSWNDYWKNWGWLHLLNLNLFVLNSNKKKREQSENTHTNDEKKEEPTRINTSANYNGYTSYNVPPQSVQINGFRYGVKKKANRKAIVFLAFLLIAACLSATIFGIVQYQKYKQGIPIGVSSSTLIGTNCETAKQKLTGAGFTNVYLRAVEDLSLSDISREKEVTKISVGGSEKFDASDNFPKNTTITISYHALKRAQVPISAKSAKKMNYQDVESLFRNAGFEYITVEKKTDLINGVITKDGSVESISINGDSKFDGSASYRIDARIVIIYHTLSK